MIQFLRGTQSVLVDKKKPVGSHDSFTELGCSPSVAWLELSASVGARQGGPPSSYLDDCEVLPAAPFPFLVSSSHKTPCRAGISSMGWQRWAAQLP